MLTLLDQNLIRFKRASYRILSEQRTAARGFLNQAVSLIIVLALGFSHLECKVVILISCFKIHISCLSLFSPRGFTNLAVGQSHQWKAIPDAHCQTTKYSEKAASNGLHARESLYVFSVKPTCLHVKLPKENDLAALRGGSLC